MDKPNQTNTDNHSYPDSERAGQPGRFDRGMCPDVAAIFGTSSARLLAHSVQGGW